MSQRMQLTLGLLMTSACLASAVSVWRSGPRDAVPDRPGENEALIGKLERLITAIESAQKPGESAPAASEWVNLNVRLVQERPEGPPAEGFIVQFPEILVSPGVPLEKVSGPTGVVELGLVRATRHSITVTAPWRETCDSKFDVRAGATSQTEVVVCPAAPPPQADVTISVDWPEDLRLANVGLICSVGGQPQNLHGGTWRDLDAVSHAAFFGGDGTVMNIHYSGTSGRSGGISWWHAKLTPSAQALFCRGAIQKCSPASIAIESKDQDDYEEDHSLFLALDADCQVVPNALELRPGGATQFKITLSESTIAEIRKLLPDERSVEQASFDEDRSNDDDNN